MNLPKLAIVGRPNVGKSALFNRICGKRIAIIDEAEGVTRDRLYAQTELFGYPFQVIDTGGIDPNSTALFNEEIKRQAEIAITEADSIVMVVDAQMGVTELDEQLARLLLRTNKPLCLAVNKVDGMEHEHLVSSFYCLGITNILPVSASHNWQIAELLELAWETRPDSKEESVDRPTHIAIIGRPNVGKSSTVNKILGDERCIASEIPGTTRDSVDITLEWDGTPCVLIDTAGVRKKNSEPEAVDKFAAIRTKLAIDRADVCLLLLDAEIGMTSFDKRIAKMIEQAGKGCLLGFNKWDLVKSVRQEHCLRELHSEVPFLRHCPSIFLSAKTGRNINQILPKLRAIDTASRERISTGRLNTFIEKILQLNPPPVVMGKRLRIYYLTQVNTQPPVFLLFVNSPNLVAQSYLRFINNQLRKEFGFEGVPLILSLKGKKVRAPAK